MAQVECLFAADILTAREGEELLWAIDILKLNFNLEKTPTVPEEAKHFEDIHSFVEFKICEKVANAGKKIHTGRSRNDQVATLLKLYLNDAIEALIQSNRQMMAILADRVEVYRDTPMPVTTHFQQAALGSVGHYLKMREKAQLVLQEDLLTLKDKNMRECPLGSGACVGSSIRLDRKIMSDLLGFESPSSNSLYSTTCRDEVLDFSFVCSKLALHLLNFVHELIIWSNQNFDWVRLPKSFCTGSSMMPNKLNPDLLELLRCDLKRVLNWPTQLLLQLSSLPSGYSRDLQIIKSDLFEYSAKICYLLDLSCSFLKELEFNRDCLQSSLELGFVDATLQMEKMVQEGIPLREAHHLMAQKVQGKKQGSFCGGDFKEALHSYKTSGGPADLIKMEKLL